MLQLSKNLSTLREFYDVTVNHFVLIKVSP